MNRFPTLIKGTTRGEQLSFKTSFVAIGPLVLALGVERTHGRTHGRTLLLFPETKFLGLAEVAETSNVCLSVCPSVRPSVRPFAP